MSDVLDRIRDLKLAGFGFLAHRDAHDEITTLQATRVHTGHIETVLIHGEHDALAARCRDEDDPAVVWHRAGPTAEVITELLDLPTPGTSRAPTLARATRTLDPELTSPDASVASNGRPPVPMLTTMRLAPKSLADATFATCSDEDRIGGGVVGLTTLVAVNLQRARENALA